MVFPLTNKEIIVFFKKDFHAQKIFKGQLIARENPNIKKIIKKFKPPAMVLLNTDRKDRLGMHWLVIHYKKNKTVFFDSLGKCPNQYAFPYSVTRSSLPVIRNTFNLQHLSSSYCGHFSVIYALLLARNYTLNEINKFFTKKNPSLNEAIAGEVLRWLRKNTKK